MASPAAHRHGSYQEQRPELLARLRRVEGQVRGIQRMIEQDAYCLDVLTQISAVIAASEKVGLKVLEEHIRGCVAEAVASDGQGAEKLAELTQALEKFLQVGRSAVSTKLRTD